MEERAGDWREDADEQSGAEYLSRNDREKTIGYNGVPHRPSRPAREKQVRAARTGERRRVDDAG